MEWKRAKSFGRGWKVPSASQYDMKSIRSMEDAWCALERLWLALLIHTTRAVQVPRLHDPENRSCEILPGFFARIRIATQGCV